MPYTGRWSEVTSVLRQFHAHMGAYTLFTFRGLVDFLILTEEQVESLGDTSLERSNAAVQLVSTAVIASTDVPHLPTMTFERNQI